MRAEHFHRQALATADAALGVGALVPLATEPIELPGLAPFQLRRLLSRTPRHLRSDGPKPNPFLPWEAPLEVARPQAGHLLLLNKYPVQPGHVLLITDHWAPQAGWLEPADWDAVATVAADTRGLWFFNSSPVAGASQPHRHLQLLPRGPEQSSCPLADAYLSLLNRSGSDGEPPPRFPWAFQLSARTDPERHSDLKAIYARHMAALGLGEPQRDGRPRHAYNLLFDDQWFLSVRRCREHAAGFSVNALGFAGWFLETDDSDRSWLLRHGPWALLQAVACPPQGGR